MSLCLLTTSPLMLLRSHKEIIAVRMHSYCFHKDHMRIYLNSIRMLLQMRRLKSNISVHMRSRARLREIQWIKLVLCSKVIAIVIIILEVNLILLVIFSFSHLRIRKAKHDRLLVSIRDKYLPCNKIKNDNRGVVWFNWLIFCFFIIWYISSSSFEMLSE